VVLNSVLEIFTTLAKDKNSHVIFTPERVGYITDVLFNSDPQSVAQAKKIVFLLGNTQIGNHLRSDVKLQRNLANRIRNSKKLPPAIRGSCTSLYKFLWGDLPEKMQSHKRPSANFSNPPPPKRTQYQAHYTIAYQTPSNRNRAHKSTNGPKYRDFSRDD
jgi:hypothetical protein